MVFSSHPLYDQLDPPDWQYHQHQHQQQQMILYGVGNEISSSITTPQHPPLQQLPLAATSGSRNIRPGSMTDRARMAKVPLPETSLKCPRCESTNTKFCYFNNYSLTQPRHFCKTCRRYWTRGGALRNVPVGGGCRRSATKRSGKKRSKSPAISSGTATATTTTTSTDHNGNNNMNMVDDVIPQLPLLNPHGSLNQMVHEFGDHYIGVGNNNNYGGSYIDPHIARLVQTGVISLTDSSTDHHHQWNKLGVTTLTPFPFLTNLAQQEHYSSQSYGLGYQLFNQCSGQLGLTESSQVEAPTMDDHQSVAVTNVKMENGGRGLKRFLELRALERSHTSMASGNGQFSMVVNQIGNTWSDVIDFTSNDEQTTGQNSL